MLSACVDTKSDLEAYVQDVKKTAKGKVEPLPAPTPIKQVTYAAQNMRSPFVLSGGSYTNAPAEVAGADGKAIKQQPRPDADRPREYLEQYPLSSYVMVGTLSKPNTSWGLVKDARGMVHAVKVGDYMGINSGLIVAITPDQIRLNETVPNGAGGWMQSRAVLNLIQAKPGTEDSVPTTTKGAATQNKTQKPANQSTQPAQNTQTQRPIQQRTQPSSSSGGTGMRGGY